MNKVLKCLVPGLIAVLIIAGCARQPHKEIASAKNAVDTAMAEGAEKYDPDGAKRLNSELSTAMAEVKSQGSHFSKNYEKARELLSKTKADAEEVRAGLGAKKEELKKRAYDSRESARSAIEGAEPSVVSWTKARKSDPETEAIRVDFQVLKKAMEDVQELLDNEDYMAPATKADSVRNKALAVSDRIKQIPARVTPQKNGRLAKKKKT